MQLLFIVCLVLCWTTVTSAASNCVNKNSAKVASLQGGLLVDAAGKENWQAAQLNDEICEGSRIHVQANSRASLVLPNVGMIRAAENTTLKFSRVSAEQTTLIDMVKGFIHFISRTPKKLEINTPIANAGPEGTEFAITVNNDNAALWVYEGAVKFYNQKGSIQLKPGQGAQAQLGYAPIAKIDITPEDAVNWALYYPPLLPDPANNPVTNNPVNKAIQDYRQGRVDLALNQLDAITAQLQSPYFHKVRGAIRLTVGQDDLALQDIQAALTHNPNDAEALALQSVRALSQNRKDEAYALANKAVTANPKSANAFTALSYAEQGRFNLVKAQAAADKAAQLAPQDGLVWARKAELELSQGLTAESQQSAQQAVRFNPDVERTKTVLGFAQLIKTDTQQAINTFEQAILLDSTSPLARLGLGLAKVRNGDLADGRQDLEIAAVLDPNNPIVRSYLGKAYYEERRSDMADTQFGLAKARDPKDPTPYFYNAINKQTTNRPVEALRDMQKAIELNDNRGVYRSSLALDNDLAVRNTSLARIYDDLGFDSRATVEATKSLTIDPTNYSAHRFLSDAYVRLPRREISQVSELLQSQLMQPLNSNPVQPHLSVKGLSTVSGLGPVEPSFKDFTSSFQRNRPYLTASGVIGNNNTYGDEAVLSGIQDNFSYSLGQYHFSTDGFRKDANVTHNIYNAFLQTALTSDISLQFEFRKRITDQGDIRMALSEQTFIPTEKRHLDQTTGRVGIKVSLTPKDMLLGSFIYSDREENANNRDPSFPEFGVKTIDYRKGIEGELQYLHDSETIDTVFGAGAYIVDLKQNTKRKIPPTLLDGFDQETCSFYPVARFISGKCYLFAPDENNNFSNTSESYSFYNYNNLNFPSNVKWTLGFSYEQFKGVNDENESAFHRRIYPKLGVQWFVKNWLRLRGVYLKTLNRQLIASQTIEPTQVAGFNQFYDDYNGTQSTLKGIGLDTNFDSRAFSGVELTERNINSNSYSALERQVRAYFNFTLSSSWAFSIENQFERYSITNEVLETNILPITLKYFDDSGFFAQFAPTLVWQQKKSGSNLKEHISSNFPLFNLSVGYRLPKRLGIISLEAQNLADKNFIFNDSYYRTGNQLNIVHPFLPTRTIMFRAILNF